MPIIRKDNEAPVLALLIFLLALTGQNPVLTSFVLRTIGFLHLVTGNDFSTPTLPGSSLLLVLNGGARG